MAEANHGIRDLPTKKVQSILESNSINDSQHTLLLVPDGTMDATGLSSVQQNLSSSFNCLQKGIASHMGRSMNQQQQPIEIEVDTEQLSPTSLCTQLAAYQNTIRDVHDQNQQMLSYLDILKQ